MKTMVLETEIKAVIEEAFNNTADLHSYTKDKAFGLMQTLKTIARTTAQRQTLNGGKVVDLCLFRADLEKAMDGMYAEYMKSRKNCLQNVRDCKEGIYFDKDQLQGLEYLFNVYDGMAKFTYAFMFEIFGLTDQFYPSYEDSPRPTFDNVDGELYIFTR